MVAALLDGRSVGVDAEAHLPLHRTLRKLGDRSTAILLTTDNPDEARASSDRVGIPAPGRVVAGREGACDPRPGRFGHDPADAVTPRQTRLKEVSAQDRGS